MLNLHISLLYATVRCSYYGMLHQLTLSSLLVCDGQNIAYFLVSMVVKSTSHFTALNHAVRVPHGNGLALLGMIVAVMSQSCAYRGMLLLLLHRAIGRVQRRLMHD